jgi:chorismate mutase
LRALAAERKRGFDGTVVLARSAMNETKPKSPVQPAADPVLAAYRKSIDNIDAALIHMLAERFRITKAVGAYKVEHDLPPSDPGREEQQIARLRKLAGEASLDPEFSEKFLRFIIEEVIRHHEQAQAKG